MKQGTLSVVMVTATAGLALFQVSLAFALPQKHPEPAKDSCFNLDREKPSVHFERGELNKFATRLPQPKYPVEARAKVICGEIVVDVIVDAWTGRVYWARVKDGDALLQEAVKKVVCQATFAPLVGEGKPIWVGGTLKYRFRCRKGASRNKGSQRSRPVPH